MRSTRGIVILAIAAIVVAHLGDRWAYQHFVSPGVYDHDFGRMLRSFGFLPLWLIGAAAIWLQTRERRTALLVALVPTAAGAICAVLQVLLRRERPALHHGEYYFRAFSDRPFHGAEFGLPSSHAMVAFAGAWLLSRIYPRAALVWVTLAIGCAATRVLAQAHFLSDVTVAAVASWFLVDLAWKRWSS